MLSRHTPSQYTPTYYASNSKTPSQFWFSLLFNVVSIPFALLLIALVAKQSVSIRDYTAETEAARDSQQPGFVGDTLF